MLYNNLPCCQLIQYWSPSKKIHAWAYTPMPKETLPSPHLPARTRWRSKTVNTWTFGGHTQLWHNLLQNLKNYCPCKTEEVRSISWRHEILLRFASGACLFIHLLGMSWEDGHQLLGHADSSLLKETALLKVTLFDDVSKWDQSECSLSHSSGQLWKVIPVSKSYFEGKLIFLPV